MRDGYPKKRFLEAESLAQRESLVSSRLITQCELGNLRVRRIGRQWFVDLDDWETNRAHFADKLKHESATFTHSPILLLALILLLTGMISWTPITIRFREGSRVLTSAVSTTIQTISANTTQVEMASVYAGLWIRLERFWLKVDQFTQTLTNNLTYFWQEAAGAWKKFFGQEQPASETANSVATTTSSTLLTLDAVALQNLKAQIKTELLRELEQSGAGTKTIPSSMNTAGLVVLPASGDPARDAAIKQDLKNSFSDRVEVKFDPSGQAGIITPLSPSGRGDNYLFILTPLKQNQ